MLLVFITKIVNFIYINNMTSWLNIFLNFFLIKWYMTVAYNNLISLEEFKVNFFCTIILLHQQHMDWLMPCHIQHDISFTNVSIEPGKTDWFAFSRFSTWIELVAMQKILWTLKSNQGFLLRFLFEKENQVFLYIILSLLLYVILI